MRHDLVLLITAGAAIPCIAAAAPCMRPIEGRWTVHANSAPFEHSISSTPDELRGLVGATAVFTKTYIRIGRARCDGPKAYDTLIPATGKDDGMYTGQKSYLLRYYGCRKGAVFPLVIGEDCDTIHVGAWQRETFELRRR